MWSALMLVWVVCICVDSEFDSDHALCFAFGLPCTLIAVCVKYLM